MQSNCAVNLKELRNFAQFHKIFFHPFGHQSAIFAATSELPPTAGGDAVFLATSPAALRSERRLALVVSKSQREVTIFLAKVPESVHKLHVYEAWRFFFSPTSLPISGRTTGESSPGRTVCLGPFKHWLKRLNERLQVSAVVERLVSGVHSPLSRALERGKSKKNKLRPRSLLR